MTQTNGSPDPSIDLDNAVTIRRAYPDDAAALGRLAALDCRLPLRGPCLVAEVDGELWAAHALDTGDVAADPFRRTADLVELLTERARHLQGPPAAAPPSPAARLAAALPLPWRRVPSG